VICSFLPAVFEAALADDNHDESAWPASLQAFTLWVVNQWMRDCFTSDSGLTEDSD
jgi:hypothetical protein